MRNERFKLVRNVYDDYDETLYDADLYDPASPAANTACVNDTVVDELYVIDQNTPEPTLDTEERDLLAAGEAALNEEQAGNYQVLRTELADLLASKASCTGDINLDGQVDQADVAEWQRYRLLTDGSSWADINQDGVTDNTDKQLIEAAFGACFRG
ncbi:dockerin type I domain-containing protein [Alcanivoracaceae bacterium MT1]